MLITPTMMVHFCKSGVLKRHDLSSLRIVMTGGSKVSEEVFNEFQGGLPIAFAMQGFGMYNLILLNYNTYKIGETL